MALNEGEVSSVKVSNPLTIIAIFSGLAETLATIALINLPPNVQETFVVFVMAFPTGIVLLFFLVLYFKNTVLYAPSDFEDQSHYLEVNKVKQNVSERLDHIFDKMNSNGAFFSDAEIKQAKAEVVRSVDEALPISQREMQIVQLYEKGLSINQMSEKLNVTPRTVHSYISRLIERGLIKEK